MKPCFLVTSLEGAFSGPGGKGMKCQVVSNAQKEGDYAQVWVDDRDEELPIPALDTTITVSMGYDGVALAQMGTYNIVEVEVAGWPRTIRITASGQSMLSNIKAPRSQDFHDKSVEEIIGMLATDSGVGSMVSGPVAAFKYNYIAQTEESNLAFATKLAVRHNAVAKVVNGSLVFFDKGMGLAAAGVIISPGTIARWPDNVKMYSALFKGGHTWTGAAADYHTGATMPEETGQNNAELVEVPSTAGRAPHSRSFYKGQHPVYRTPPLANDGKPLAQATADGKDNQLNQDATILNISIIGTPTAFADGFLMVQNVRTGIDGVWTMKTVTHTIDTSGYDTHIVAESQKPSTAYTQLPPATIENILKNPLNPGTGTQQVPAPAPAAPAAPAPAAPVPAPGEGEV